jgi:SpoVK/Ycf46/Vps4 family AAA+-type ATPase
MTLDNIKQTPQTVIAVQKDGTSYYTQALGRSTLGSGLYRMKAIVADGEYIPGFTPVEISNDPPVEIDNSISEISQELQTFLGRREIFKKMGFAHKRGYLFHGPPGCGKSSTLRLLESLFVEKFDGLVLFWDNGGSVQDYYEHVRRHEPERPVMLVCEDIDNQVSSFEESILEFLDGHQGLNNFVLVSTTNNLEAIPSRIKDRPSRIDRLVAINKPSQEIRYNYLLSAGISKSSALDLAKRTDGLSIAQLKEILVAVVCLEQPLKPVLERLKVADMSPLEGNLLKDDTDEYDDL